MSSASRKINPLQYFYILHQLLPIDFTIPLNQNALSNPTTTGLTYRRCPICIPRLHWSLGWTTWSGKNSMSKNGKNAPPLNVSTDLLETAETGHLAMCREGEPYMVPLSFVYHEGRIFFHGSTSGKKMDFINANPRVCFVVDESELVPGPDPCKLHFNFRSTLANGTARVVNDIEGQVEALRLLAEKYSPGSGHLMDRQRAESYDNLAIIEMTVDEITSREEPVE